MGKRKRHKQNGQETGEITIELPSGFTVSVRSMPPYYLDIIKDAIALPEYPRREIVLAAGDIIFVDYEPEPGQVLEPGDEDYELWVRWMSVDQDRERLEQLRRRARMDFLLANCVYVVNGPYSLDDDEWIANVEAAFDDFVIPAHPGKRKVIFLKTLVLNDQNSMSLVMNSAISEEVSMQGVTNALRGF